MLVLCYTISSNFVHSGVTAGHAITLPQGPSKRYSANNFYARNAILSIRFKRTAVDSTFELGLDNLGICTDRWNGRYSHRTVSRDMDQDENTVFIGAYHLHLSGWGLRGFVPSRLSNDAATCRRNGPGRRRTLVRWSTNWSTADRTLLRATRRIGVSFEPRVYPALRGMVSELSHQAGVPTRREWN